MIKILSLFLLTTLNLSLTGQSKLSVNIAVKNLPISPKFRGTSIVDARAVIDTPFVVKYEMKQTGNGFSMRYDCPYVKQAKQTNNNIVGLDFSHTPFHFQLPVLVLTLKNTGNAPLSIERLSVTVKKSQIDKSPILVLGDKKVNQLLFMNEGWGKVNNPQITIQVVDVGTYDSGEILKKVKKHTRSIPAFDSLVLVPIDSFIPGVLKKERLVGVFGDLNFLNDSTQKQSVAYRTRVILSASPTAPPEKEEDYDLFLEAGKSGYTQNVPIKITLKKGETKMVSIALATNKTADFSTTLEFIGANNEKLGTTIFDATVFMPRSIARLNNFLK